MGKDKMSLRDEFALKAMEIIYVRTKHLQISKELAIYAYQMADWMLKERDK